MNEDGQRVDIDGAGPVRGLLQSRVDGLGHLLGNAKPRFAASGVDVTGMTLEEIEKYVGENCGDEDFGFRPQLYFGNAKPLQKNKLILNGFGVAIPTPRLILTVHNDKLVRWKERGGTLDDRDRRA